MELVNRRALVLVLHLSLFLFRGELDEERMCLGYWEMPRDCVNRQTTVQPEPVNEDDHPSFDPSGHTIWHAQPTMTIHLSRLPGNEHLTAKGLLIRFVPRPSDNLEIIRLNAVRQHLVLVQKTVDNVSRDLFIALLRMNPRGQIRP